MPGMTCDAVHPHAGHDAASMRPRLNAGDDQAFGRGSMLAEMLLQ